MIVSDAKQINLWVGTRPAALLYGALAAWLLLIILGILVLNNGHFAYTLDDAYIHLAMSEGIHAGRYGINPTEYASASSSILFPYLLAWASPYPFHEYVPLALNVGGIGRNGHPVPNVLHGNRNGSVATNAASPRRRFAAALPIALNLVGLVFMGMEHSLQVMLDVAIFLGVIRTIKHRHVDSWLPVALFLAPLVRYESLLISGSALIVLVSCGFWKLATVTGLLIAASVGAFSLYLTSIGLSPLPNSIAAHSKFVDQAITGSHGVSILFTVLRQFMINLFQLRGPILFVFAVVFGVIMFRAQENRPLARGQAGRALWLRCLHRLPLGRQINGDGAARSGCVHSCRPDPRLPVP